MKLMNLIFIVIIVSCNLHKNERHTNIITIFSCVVPLYIQYSIWFSTILPSWEETNACMYSEDTVDSVGIFSDSDAMNCSFSELYWDEQCYM